MDKFASEIQNIRVRKAGAKNNPVNVVEASVILEAWDGYLDKHWVNGKEITDKKITLYFDCYNGNNTPDCRAEINAYRHLIENQFAIRDSILRALASIVDTFTQYLDRNDSFVPKIIPGAEADFDFKSFIGPLSISFHEESKDDLAYLDWHFQCEWDPEHGFAVTTHGERVIHIDQDTDIWKIYEDNGTLAERRKEYNQWARNFNPKPKEVKPWWQFW